MRSFGPHFGIDCPKMLALPDCSVVRDAKFAASLSSQRARCFMCAGAERYYSNDLMKMMSCVRIFCGVLLVTNTAPGRLNRWLTEALAEVDRISR